ncbi:MAG: hypothetical protein J6K61_04555 [Clostridia bacterium]|nr:hypothetical protein [Clostridia bacterium]
MKKNVYSLILSEEVVDAIDRQAYQKGTNRSALINQILAEYVSYTTPSMHRAQIFGGLQEALSGVPLKHLKTSDTFFVVASSLSYKYNPTVKYSVELYMQEGLLGEFKATLRTQNATLMEMMAEFCLLWHSLEEKVIGEVKDRMEPARYSRVFSLRREQGLSSALSAKELGELIADYIRAFDTALKEYFRLVYNPSLAQMAVEAVYRQYITQTSKIM